LFHGDFHCHFYDNLNTPNEKLEEKKNKGQQAQGTSGKAFATKTLGLFRKLLPLPVIPLDSSVHPNIQSNLILYILYALAFLE
jgi:hypothetical protein